MTELENYLYETMKQIQLIVQSAEHAELGDKLALVAGLCARARREYETRKEELAAQPPKKLKGPGGIHIAH